MVIKKKINSHGSFRIERGTGVSREHPQCKNKTSSSTTYCVPSRGWATQPTASYLISLLAKEILILWFHRWEK